MQYRQTTYHKQVEKWLKEVKKNEKAEYAKIVSLILKLAKKGEAIVDGDKRTFKKMGMTSSYNSHPIIQIKIKTKQHRIHTLLTPNYLYIINAFHKKSNKTPQNHLKTTFSRAKSVTKY